MRCCFPALPSPLAIGSHFSAFLFAPALGIYAIWRMWAKRPSVAVISAWIAGQLVALGLCAFLYFTQIRQLSRYFGGQDATQGWMGNAYLSHSIFHPRQSEPAGVYHRPHDRRIPVRLSSLAVGDLAFILFIAGVVLDFSQAVAFGLASPRASWAMLLLPFAINCAAALVRAYPYGGPAIPAC